MKPIAPERSYEQPEASPGGSEQLSDLAVTPAPVDSEQLRAEREDGVPRLALVIEASPALVEDGGADRRSRRLMKVTAALAEAVEARQVHEAVVDRVASALGASSAGLWIAADDGQSAKLARSVGYSEAARRTIESLPLDGSLGIPVLDALRLNQPIWIASQAELIAAYPHLGSVVSRDRSYSIACLPLAVQGNARGVLGFTFDDERALDLEERDVLQLVARYASQSIERLRLLEAQRKLNESNEQGRVRAEILYDLAASVIQATTLEEVFDAALDGIERALGADRCSILAFDAEGTMKFRAWRGLSEEYRTAVEGHSPWTRDVENPQPIVVADVRSDPACSAFTSVLEREKIGALGFIPLVGEGRLIGKFMVYYPQPRRPSSVELDMAQAIANHVAAAMGRFSALTELQQTVRFNELFTGMLGHDLRNPLAAIMTAAQIMIRDGSEQRARPLSRILSSGARMARMIDQLLDFTRLRVGAGIPLELRCIDIVSTIRQVVDELEDASPGWKFQIHATTLHTEGRWDPDRISQVFSNLVANAVQHGVSDQGVTIVIDEAMDGVIVRVANGGMIPEELLPKLFEPMTGSDRRGSGSHGLGLGLCITEQIVKAHGGTISVQTSETDGTRFTVYLPRALRARGSETSS